MLQGVKDRLSHFRSSRGVMDAHTDICTPKDKSIGFRKEEAIHNNVHGNGVRASSTKEDHSDANKLISRTCL